MSYIEIQSEESGDEDRDDDEGAKYLVTYRVRVCTRCGHAACQYCNSWCDICLNGFDPSDEETAREVNAACAEDQHCVYDEPDEEAVVEVRREKVIA